ncbi:MAG: glucokinase [Acidiferrobacter sp.]
MRESDVLLIGDIGGTKTDLLVVSKAAGLAQPLARARLKSAEYPNLQTLLGEFLRTAGLSVRHACLDVAGPVINGRAQLTNLPWEVDGATLRAELAFTSVDILNDLAAVAHAIPTLQATDLKTLNAGEDTPGATKAIIAPGTGLGEAFLVWDGARYLAQPSEGGHADFAAPTPELTGLAPYLRGRYDHVSYEMVCSGIGIPHLYDFFRDQDGAQESPAFAARLAASPDRTPLILEAALRPDTPNPLCSAAVDAFLTILAAEAGNLALKVFALGGIYIAGGIPPRLLPLIDRARFAQTFCAKGRFAKLLTQIPVHMVVNPDATLMGTAAYGWARMHRSPTPPSPP